MPYGLIEDLPLYEVAGCPLILPDGSTLGYVEGFKRHKGGCEVWLLRTEDDREIQFPIYEQIIVDCRPYEYVIIDPPKYLLDMYRDGRSPRNPCEIVRREVNEHMKKKAA